jgi:hypothetical protein
MNCRRETVEKSVPPWIRGVLEQYVAGSDTRGRPEGRSYLRSQQAIHKISGLENFCHFSAIEAAIGGLKRLELARW